MLQGINMTTSMQFGNTLYSYYLYIIPAIPFYIITLEEYFTHIMDLPVFNAASEGCLSVAVVFLIPIFLGKDIWV
jgi:ethanolaminephosphotransferase